MTGLFDLTAAQTAALAFAFFLGGFAKGGTGFAFPLLVLPITNRFVPLDLALAIIAVLQPFINTYQFANGGKMRETLFRYWPMLAGMTLGAPAGAALLPIMDRQMLALAVGIFIVAFVLWVVLRPNLRIPSRRERPIGGAAGVLAGALGTLTTINGPVFVAFLLGVNADRQTMISALGLFFIVSGILISSSYLVIGVLNAERALIALACAAPCILGVLAGNAAGRRISPELFRRIVLALLFALGAHMTLTNALAL